MCCYSSISRSGSHFAARAPEQSALFLLPLSLTHARYTHRIITFEQKIMMQLEYHKALAALPGAVLVPGSEQERQGIERFKTFFADFSPNKVGKLLDDTYADALYFNDTIKTMRDREALRHYLKESANAVDDCQVEVQDVINTGKGDLYLRWVMKIRFKKFKKSIDTYTIGLSHVRFNAEGRVIFHQDFWDSTQGIFEHVPIVGWMIRKLKARM
jgi:ketosteroid isomerase-like protein